MKLILAHQYLARRLRWSMVYSEDRHRIFMEKHLYDCLRWCQEEGHEQVTVSDGETALLLLSLDTPVTQGEVNEVTISTPGGIVASIMFIWEAL